MKVENMTAQAMQSMPRGDVAVIKVDEIKNILYLGIKGDLKLMDSGSSHAVDTYA
jgi:hypothetical protein